MSHISKCTEAAQIVFTDKDQVTINAPAKCN